MREGDGVVTYGMSRPAGAALLVFWFAVLAGAAAARQLTDYGDHAAQPAHWFEAFYRVGSLIYGGGQVVLPMLIQETVQKTCSLVDGVQVPPPPPTPAFLCGVVAVWLPSHSPPPGAAPRRRLRDQTARTVPAAGTDTDARITTGPTRRTPRRRHCFASLCAPWNAASAAVQWSDSPGH